MGVTLLGLARVCNSCRDISRLVISHLLAIRHDDRRESEPAERQGALDALQTDTPTRDSSPRSSRIVMNFAVRLVTVNAQTQL